MKNLYDMIFINTALRIGRKVGYRVRRFMRQDVLREC